ncbi:MAG TPA: transglutaminase-like cysteine peptidase, partial [Pseudolabrys sp.]|nr:transglutaminase-like cysteine peptidase [Pseudolabrys sp.]
AVPTATNPSWPAPARFFTINQVLAGHQQPASKSSAVRVAAIDPAVVASDAAPAGAATPAHGDEPFGLFTFRAPDGLVWVKWRKVEADIENEAPALARCRAAPESCSAAAARFLAIVEDAANHEGRARLELVNKRVNAAIRYSSDAAQWRRPDVWSAPLDAEHKGSFETGLGDCEDYAIAKYAVLRAAGVAAKDLRLLLVRDNAVRLDHAVLAARENGKWLVLDNRWSSVLEDAELNQFAPLFALNDDGVKLFATPYAAKRQPAGNASLNGQLFAAGASAGSPLNGARTGVMTLPLVF